MNLRFIEAGKSNQVVMLLIHGVQVPWQVLKKHIVLIEKFLDSLHLAQKNVTYG